MDDEENLILSDDDLDILEEDVPLLRGVRLFAAQANLLPWFSMLGKRLTPDIRSLSHAYLDGLGLPDVEIGPVADWEEAADAAASFAYDTMQWEAEEAMRASLTMDALERISEDALSIALTHVSALLGERIGEAAREAAHGECGDDELINAAAGAAVQAVYGAALALLADAEPAHPFQHKFALFARGRWPIAVSGRTLNIF